MIKKCLILSFAFSLACLGADESFSGKGKISIVPKPKVIRFGILASSPREDVMEQCLKTCKHNVETSYPSDQQKSSYYSCMAGCTGGGFTIIGSKYDPDKVSQAYIAWLNDGPY